MFREGEKAPTTYREKLRDALGAGFFAKLTATVITYPHEVPPLPARVCLCVRGVDFGGLGCADAVTAGSVVDGRSKEEV